MMELVLTICVLWVLIGFFVAVLFVYVSNKLDEGIQDEYEGGFSQYILFYLFGMVFWPIIICPLAYKSIKFLHK